MNKLQFLIMLFYYELKYIFTNTYVFPWNSSFRPTKENLDPDGPPDPSPITASDRVNRFKSHLSHTASRG